MSYRLNDGIEFMKSLSDDSVDGIFTDPPWGTSQRRAFRKLVNQDRWEKLLSEMTIEAARVLKPNGVCLLWFGLTGIDRVIKAVRGLEYRWSLFVSYMPPRHICRFQSCIDPILIYQPPGAKWPNPGYEINQIYFNASTGKKDTRHPCARPFKSVKQILYQVFGPGKKYIIDPFAGSDTTGVACRELGFEWETCEIDPEMYETGLARHAQGFLFE